MQNFWKCVKRKFNIIKWPSQNIPEFIADSEELVRRCKKKAIRNNGKINKNAFYYGYHEISVDRSRYRSYEKTLHAILPEDPNDWCLIKGIVQNIKLVQGVEKIISDPSPHENNPAHALIVCTKDLKKRSQIAAALTEKFQKIPKKQYELPVSK